MSRTIACPFCLEPLAPVVVTLECYRGGRWRGREACTSWDNARRCARALRRRGFVVAVVQPSGQLAWWDHRGEEP